MFCFALRQSFLLLHVTKLKCFQYFFRNQFRGNTRQLLRRFSWELPQTVIGGWYTCFIMAFFPIHEMACFDGVLVIKCRIGRDAWGGICFGSIILGDCRIAAEINNSLFMHEFGHTLQSRDVGPIYLFKYGIPSLLSAYGTGRHACHPVEEDANQRAFEWFSQRDTFKNWENDFNPLPKDGVKMPIKWWEFLPPHFPLMHLYKAIRMRNQRSS